MTTTGTETAAASTADGFSRPHGLAAVVHDTRIIAWRNLVQLPRTPQLVLFTLIQPVMFVVLFNYVFGGAIGASLPSGISYAQFLIPGIMVQTIVFGSSATSVGLADDLQKGIIDRFRSLPIARVAVLGGRIGADTVRLSAVAVVLVLIGYVVGFRFRGGPGMGLAMVLVAVAFGSAMCWVMANIGMRVKDAETAQTAGFVWLFPLTFVSSVFTPVATMPDWLQVLARNNPVTLVANLLRALSLGMPAPGSTWAEMAIPVAAWILGITGVAATLAVRRYRQV
jgi:ABC-2 type transport system permease protein/oleandomycin transport system permease protein